MPEEWEVFNNNRFHHLVPHLKIIQTNLVVSNLQLLSNNNNLEDSNKPLHNNNSVGSNQLHNRINNLVASNQLVNLNLKLLKEIFLLEDS